MFNEELQNNIELNILKKSGIIDHILNKPSEKRCKIKCCNLRDHLEFLHQRMSPRQVYKALANIVERGGGKKSEVSYDGKRIDISPKAVDIIKGSYS